MNKTLSELCSPDRSICYGIVQPGRPTDTGKPILRVKDLSGNRINISEAMRVEESIEAKYKRSRVRTGDVLVSLVGSMGQVAIAGPDVDGWNIARAIGLVPVVDHHHAEWVRYSIQSREAQQFIQDHANTTVQATFNLKDLARLPIPYPAQETRNEVLGILGSLDDKIEMNRKTAATLEEMARALYRSWFVDFDPVHAKAAGRAPAHMDAQTAALFPDSFGEDGLPEGWEAQGLSKIATFLNGAALQKYPAKDGDESLPVIKIAELRNGVTPKSGRASKDIPAKFLIENGDVIFSWSGSLLQRVWTNGAGALNQHLFKVSSDLVPKWFHFFAVDQHMGEFRHIAQSKATTMGHIQRHHLDEATVNVPTNKVMDAADTQISPLFDKLVALKLENQTLAVLRDALLPRLMSGELRVGEAREQVEAVA